MKKNEEFIASMDSTFLMRSCQWLEDYQKQGNDITILDVRPGEAFEKGNITGSISIPLKELPERYIELNKSKAVIAYCGGSVLSAYSIMFLYSKDFKEIYNLSGGYSGWVKYESEKCKS